MSIHVSGLVSGLDTETLVNTLLENSIYQTRITKSEEEVTELTAEVAAWADISGYMTTLTDSLYTLYSSSKTTWDLFTATSSDEDVLTGSAGTGAITGTYQIVVTNLAQAHSVSSDKASVLAAGADADTDLIAEGVLTLNNTFTIEGVTFTVGANEYGQTVSGTESLSTLKAKINYAANEGSFDNQVGATIIDDRLVITRQDTGADDIVMSEGTGTVLQDLQIFSAPATYKVANELVVAQDASFTVNGIAVTRSSNTSLTDVINDVTLNLYDDGGATATLTVARDTETPKNAILDFITNYNAVITQIESYNSIDLTDPDNPVVGTLQGETLIRMIPASLRSLATKVNDDMTSENAGYTYNGSTGILNSLQSIGMWTGSENPDLDGYSYANRLTLLDETRLDYMLANYFDKVEQLFKGVSGGEEDGWAEGLYNYSNNVSKTSTGEIAKKTDALSDKINDRTTLIEDLTDDLADYEEQLWRDFTAMEDAVSLLQSDLASLVSQLGLNQDE